MSQSSPAYIVRIPVAELLNTQRRFVLPFSRGRVFSGDLRHDEMVFVVFAEQAAVC